MSMVADLPCILRQYDAEMRADPPPEPGVSRAWSGGVLRTTGAYHLIGYSALAGADVDREIEAQVAFFRTLGVAVEWKLYGHDRPCDLAAHLAQAGFVADETEHFMVCDLEAGTFDDLPPDGIEIRQVRDLTALEDFALAAGLAFDRDETCALDAYAARLADPTLALLVAYDDGRPVAAGRLEMPRGRAFAGLWGGGTVPGHRGRGIYRALVAARAWEALWRGYRYLTVDARATSRPILERLGFIELTRVTGWTLAP
ncbi:GNAT family N-acetyltransferase [Aliidongia dinghuensis]|nr:GNAT family N-acetyltransferase [Aliidongia dinghuensis]